MTLADLIYQHSLRLPEPRAREALEFIMRLEQRSTTQSSPSMPTKTRPDRRPGSAKGILTIHAEDDDHLIDFAKYMP